MLIEKFIEYLKIEKNYSVNTLTAYKKDLIEFQVFINENFDYTLKLFEKNEESRLEGLKEQALEDTVKVDRIVEEKVETPAPSPYMSELSKY